MKDILCKSCWDNLSKKEYKECDSEIRSIKVKIIETCLSEAKRANDQAWTNWYLKLSIRAANEIKCSCR